MAEAKDSKKADAKKTAAAAGAPAAEKEAAAGGDVSLEGDDLFEEFAAQGESEEARGCTQHQGAQHRRARVRARWWGGCRVCSRAWRACTAI